MSAIEESAADEQPIRITAEMLDVPPAVDVRVDFEQGMGYAPPATLLLLVILGTIFGWQLSSGALASEESIIAAGALVRERVAQGEWWRLLSATVLHGSVEHILGNAMSLYILGMASEHAYGARSMLLIYLASGIAGSVLSAAMGPGPSVGASGAIFGLMGAVMVLFWRHHHELMVRDKRIGVVVAVWALFTIATGLMVPMIDNAAHLGGMFGGMVMAWMIRPRILARRVVYLRHGR
ncbi:MAG TPA: rhomboid family intramembrane serine protease [Gemmatimonadaceae bacterium]|nr:rhomboid family intramembrane serine protease [Gemmatimonadaceae bacterium]